MPDIMPHFCTGVGCEALHGGSRESDDVRIAKINADRDIRVAELARSESRQEIEAEVEQAEIMADAIVDEAVVEAEVLSDILTPDPIEGEPAPEAAAVPVEMPEAEMETEPAPGPAEIESEPVSDEKGGWWSGYR